MDYEQLKALFAPRNVHVYMTHAELNEGGVRTCVAMRRGVTAPWELTGVGKELVEKAKGGEKPQEAAAAEQPKRGRPRLHEA